MLSSVALAIKTQNMVNRRITLSSSIHHVMKAASYVTTVTTDSLAQLCLVALNTFRCQALIALDLATLQTAAKATTATHNDEFDSDGGNGDGGSGGDGGDSCGATTTTATNTTTTTTTTRMMTTMRTTTRGKGGGRRPEDEEEEEDAEDNEDDADERGLAYTAHGCWLCQTVPVAGTAAAPPPCVLRTSTLVQLDVEFRPLLHHPIDAAFWVLAKLLSHLPGN